MNKYKHSIIALAINILSIYFISDFQETGLRSSLSKLYKFRDALSTTESPPNIIDIEISHNTFLENTNIKDCLKQYRGSINTRCLKRNLHADLAKRLNANGASLIVFNLLLRESRGDEDTYFANAIRETGNVLLQDYQERRFIGSDLEIVDVTPPISPLAESAASAPLPVPEDNSLSPRLWMFLDLMHAQDDTVQSYIQPILPVVAIHLLALKRYTQQVDSVLRPVSAEFAEIFDSSGQNYNQRTAVYSIIKKISNLFNSSPHLPEQLTAALEHRDDIDLEEKRYLFALLRIYQSNNDFNLNPYGPEHTIRTIQYHQVDQAILEDPAVFRNKVVFIGPSVEWGRSVKGGVINTAYGEISSTEFAATAFANLRDDFTLKTPARDVSLAISCFWLLLILSLQIKLTNRRSALALCALSGLYMFGGLMLFVHTNLLLPWAIILFQSMTGVLTSTIAHYIAQRQKLHTIINLSLPPELTTIFEPSDFELMKQGSNHLGVCMSTDGEGYTKLGKTKGEKWLATFMLAYQPVVDHCIRKYQGAIKDWAGDGMVALWVEKPKKHQTDSGFSFFKLHDPPASDIRAQALQAALALQFEVNRFNQTRDVHFPLRIGISYGSMWLSFVDELKAFGDTINIASRVEFLNKELQTRILVTEEMVNDQHAFIFRRLGKFLLRGHNQPITVFELMGLANTFDPEIKMLCLQFEHALSCYENGFSDHSMALFADILRNYPNDGPTHYYFHKCAEQSQTAI